MIDKKKPGCMRVRAREETGVLLCLPGMENAVSVLRCT